MALGFAADVGLELRIERAEQSRLARVNARLLIVDAGGEKFGGRQRDGDAMSADADVFRTKLA